MIVSRNTLQKHWLTMGIVAAALTLSACDKKEDVPMETDPVVDAQTPVEAEATGVATADSTDEVAVATADDNMAMNDDMAMTDSEETAIAMADDSEVLDGTEDNEHISTY